MGRSKREKSQKTTLEDLLELQSEAEREAYLEHVVDDNSTLRSRLPNSHDVMEGLSV